MYGFIIAGFGCLLVGWVAGWVMGRREYLRDLLCQQRHVDAIQTAIDTHGPIEPYLERLAAEKKELARMRGEIEPVGA